MDLEEFEIIGRSNSPVPKSFSPSSALTYLDKEWFTPRSKHARRMDLLGDYAGSELFVIDGMDRSYSSKWSYRKKNH